ncbi:MAG: hypothetical protein JXR83_22890 [Deltaproteobacteria bacterium]|nr:hypothetical protein [Deltaproteobacteria bacterium]
MGNRPASTGLTRGTIALALLASGGGCDIFAALAGGEGLACYGDESCAAGLTCIGGRCLPGCLEDLDCRADQRCENNTCIDLRDGGADSGAADSTPGDSRRPDASHDASTDAGHDSGPDAGGDAGPRDRAVRDGMSTDLAHPEAGTDAALARCGHLSAIQDDFERGLQALWFPYSSDDGITATVQHGLAEIAIAAMSSFPGGYAGIYSYYAADLRDDALAVEVVDLDLPASGAQAYLQLVHDEDNALAIGFAAGELIAVERAAGVSQGASIPFDRDAHRWWRISERNGSIDFSVSATGLVWTRFFTTPTAGHLARGFVDIGAGVYVSGDTSGGLVKFDNLNLDSGRQLEPWCPVRSLRDDFAGGVARPEWTVTRSTELYCTVTWSHGQVQAEMQIEAGRWCGILTGSAYDLEGSAADIEIATRPGQPGVWTMLFAWQPQAMVAFGFDGNELRAEIYDDVGSSLWSTRLAAGVASRLRIARAYDQLQFESRPSNAIDWQVAAATRTELHFDTVQVGVQIYSDISAPASHVSATLRHYNTD